MDINSDNLRTFFPALLTSGDDEDYERFCQLLRPRKLAAGEALVRRGGRSGALSLVVHGRLAVALNGPAGVMPLGETGSGSWVGELSLIRPANAQADVVATADTLLWELRHDDFEQLRREHPRSASRLLQTLCQALVIRLRRSSDRVLALAREGQGPSGIV